ncbi:hypothetical protein [Kaarinaea lacus]
MNRGGMVAFVLLLAATTAAEAGKIYGSLQVDGQAIAEGTQVSVNCAGTSYIGNVGNHGRYSVNVDREGPCVLSVNGFAGATTDVVSYNEATRYNFLLTRSGSGYNMERK